MTLVPDKVERLPAIQLIEGYSAESLLLRDTQSDGSPWKRVRCFNATRRPFEGTTWLDELFVMFTDGSELFFDQNDVIEVGILAIDRGEQDE